MTIEALIREGVVGLRAQQQLPLSPACAPSEPVPGWHWRTRPRVGTMAGPGAALFALASPTAADPTVATDGGQWQWMSRNFPSTFTPKRPLTSRRHHR